MKILPNMVHMLNVNMSKKAKDICYLFCVAESKSYFCLIQQQRHCFLHIAKKMSNFYPKPPYDNSLI